MTATIIVYEIPSVGLCDTAEAGLLSFWPGVSVGPHSRGQNKSTQHVSTGCEFPKVLNGKVRQVPNGPNLDH